MKYTLIILSLLILTLNCKSIQTDTKVEPFPPVANCDNLPPAQQFACIPGLLTRSQKVFNDPGRIISFAKVDSDTNCSRYKMVYEIGDISLPQDQRLTRTITFSACSGSVWQQIKENGEVSIFSFIAGYFAGFVSAVGVLK